MKRSYAVLTAWLLVIITAIIIFYEVTIAVSGVMIFSTILIGFGLFVLAILESLYWYVDLTGPYGGILYKKKK